MSLSTLNTHLSMDPETPDAESLATTFENVRGVRRGMERIPIFRSCKNDEAALGKSRRLMLHVVIKQQRFTHTICSFHSQGIQSKEHPLRIFPMLAKARPSRYCQKRIGCPTSDTSQTQKRKKEPSLISFGPILRRRPDF